MVLNLPNWLRVVLAVNVFFWLVIAGLHIANAEQNHGDYAEIGVAILGRAEVSDPLARPFVNDPNVRMFYTNVEAGNRYTESLYPDEFWLYHLHFDWHPELLQVVEGASKDNPVFAKVSYVVVRNDKGDGVHWFVTALEPTDIDTAFNLGEGDGYSTGTEVKEGKGAKP